MSTENKRDRIRPRMKYWEIIADNLKKCGWSLGYVSAIDSKGASASFQGVFCGMMRIGPRSHRQSRETLRKLVLGQEKQKDYIL